MTYGGSLPAFDTSYTGFVNGDTSSVVTGLSCGAVDASGKAVSSSTPVGSYNITCSGASAAGYTINYQSATLTIQRAPLTITANDKSMTYGGAVPTFDATFSSLLNGDTPGSLALGGSVATCTAKDANGNAVGPITQAGTYAITCSGANSTITRSPTSPAA